MTTNYMNRARRPQQDEWVTPRYGVEPLLEFLQGNEVIWCPFDKEESEFVRVFEENGFKVLYSHIDYGQDFFCYEPEEDYDVIISNPPFSIKDHVLRRLNALGKPYAILFPLPSVQGQKRFDVIKDDQMLVFDKRIDFSKEGEVKKGACFASIYLCRDFLPKDLIFREIERDED